MRKAVSSILIGGVSLFSSNLMLVTTAVGAVPPTRIGQCSDTFIGQLGTRLADATTGASIPGSGTSVVLTNGIYLVSYDDVPMLSQDSKVGDRVKLCLRSIPQHCPPGDNRGRIYSLLNYRTGGSVELPDSQHFCGGA